MVRCLRIEKIFDGLLALPLEQIVLHKGTQSLSSSTMVFQEDEGFENLHEICGDPNVDLFSLLFALPLSRQADPSPNCRNLSQADATLYDIECSKRLGGERHFGS